ncbi:hypothetical protein [Spirochaeta africana]|uniref:Uncharacterized protein n=1 Tax=Spirochaeta africana (strain ATCC 700263 / DSM 8902 / Z-7692) TaxID=889378 RepID=H9UF35_SPIAZ|nr:hypothetical protein [Spirochaeta africana]AFG36128.1 hypothetical protein Spiaf_0018 [Spirochaeta africana DSM 8902]
MHLFHSARRPPRLLLSAAVLLLATLPVFAGSTPPTAVADPAPPAPETAPTLPWPQLTGFTRVWGGAVAGVRELPGTVAADGRGPVQLFAANPLYGMELGLQLQAAPAPGLHLAAAAELALDQASMEFAAALPELYLQLTTPTRYDAGLQLAIGRRPQEWGIARLLNNPANLVSDSDQAIGLGLSARLLSLQLQGLGYLSEPEESDTAAGHAVYSLHTTFNPGWFRSSLALQQRTAEDLPLRATAALGFEAPLPFAPSGWQSTIDTAAEGTAIWEPELLWEGEFFLTVAADWRLQRGHQRRGHPPAPAPQRPPPPDLKRSQQADLHPDWRLSAEYHFDSTVLGTRGNEAAVRIKTPYWRGPAGEWRVAVNKRYAWADGSGSVTPKLTGQPAPQALPHTTLSAALPIAWGGRDSIARQNHDLLGERTAALHLTLTLGVDW